MDIINWTVVTDDEENYGFIKTRIQAPWKHKTDLTITGLTCLCTIVVLDVGDYITIDGNKYVINDEFTNLNAITLAEILNELFADVYSVEVSNAETLIFRGCNTIDDASYQMKQVCGIVKLPLQSEEEGSGSAIKLKTHGNFLSTPILYLLSNLGKACYQNSGDSFEGKLVAMRIINSFSPNIPIIVSNADFSVTVPSSSLSEIWFQLVDANFVPIKLKNPMYTFKEFV